MIEWKRQKMSSINMVGEREGTEWDIDGQTKGGLDGKKAGI